MRDIYKVLQEHELQLNLLLRKVEAIKLVVSLLEQPEPAPEVPPQSTQTTGEGVQAKVRWP